MISVMYLYWEEKYWGEKRNNVYNFVSAKSHISFYILTKKYLNDLW